MVTAGAYSFHFTWCSRGESSMNEMFFVLKNVFVLGWLNVVRLVGEHSCFYLIGQYGS